MSRLATPGRLPILHILGRDTHGLVEKVYQAFGGKRIMWGTDWPVCLGKATYAQTLSVVRDEMDFSHPKIGNGSWAKLRFSSGILANRIRFQGCIGVQRLPVCNPG